MNTYVRLAAAALIFSGAASLSSCGKRPAEEKDRTYAPLSAIRTALQAYYGDHEGRFPDSLAELTKDGKYLKELPKADLPRHSDSNAVIYVSGPALDPKNLTDAGGYAYYNSDKYPDTKGAVVFNCTHANKKGAPIYSY